MQKLKSLIKKSEWLYSVLARLYRMFNFKLKNAQKEVQKFESYIQEKGLIHPQSELQIFAPNSSGDDLLLSKLTVLSANQTFPFLESFIELIHGTIKIFDIEQFGNKFNGYNIEFAQSLKKNFDKYGSDKASTHNYFLIYSKILESTGDILGVLEIGLGSNNTEIASNMGVNGKPGASLRAFRDSLPNAQIFGADFDKSILFNEDRISTFFVDQTKPKTFDLLSNSIKGDLNLIIDDGLHSPNANIATLQFALERMINQKSKGWIVIEDIPISAISIWKLVSFVIPKSQFSSYIIQTKSAILFACYKH
jgi:hypothetical protein